MLRDVYFLKGNGFESLKRSDYGIKYWFGYWRHVYGPDHL